MPLFACSEFNEAQQCVQWQEVPAQTFLGLPDITQEQAEQLMIPLLLALVIIMGIKYVKRAFL